MPEEFRHCFGITPSENGWIGISSAGLLPLGQRGAANVLVRPPGGDIIRLAVPHHGGLLVAGQGRAFLYLNGKWRVLDVTDYFWSAVPAGDVTLLVGAKGVYKVAEDGKTERLRAFTSPRAANAFTIYGTPYIFASADGVFRWNELKLERVDEDVSWAKGTHVASVQELDTSRLFVVTGRGGWLIHNGAGTPVCPGIWKTVVPELLLNATLYEGTLVVSTFYGGVKAFDIANEQLLWQIGISELGGNLYSATRFEEGLFIGSVQGVFFLPDPRQLLCSTIPQGDIRFVYMDGNSALLGLTTGIFVHGSDEQVHPANTYSITRTPGGTRVLGLFGSIQFGEQKLAIGGRDVYGMVALDDSTVATCQYHGVNVVTSNGIKTELPIDVPANSIARTQRGEIVVGTAAGARVSARNGIELRRFGEGRTRVFQLADRVVSFDSAGHAYWDNGVRFAHLRFTEIIDAVLWNAQVCVLGRSESGETWLGVIDPSDGKWQALDVPIPANVGAIAEIDGNLTIFSPGNSLQVKKPRTLDSPSLANVLLNGRYNLASGLKLELAADQPSLEIKFPRPRLFPWRSPSYTVRLQDEEPQPGVAGEVLKIPRLNWGLTKVVVEANWAGSSSTAEFNVYRARPWWARSPGFAILASTLVMIGYGSIRFRTRALERRAKQLQLLIDERTVELRTAQKAREEFFSTLSHEIRNPLNGVVGLCEIVEADKQNVAVTERGALYVRTLKGCADQLRSILDDVLDFSRIDRGEIQISPSPMEITSVVEGGVRSIDATLKHCSIETPAGPYWVVGDAGRIRQVVANLVSNALKFGEPAKAEVQVRAEVGQDGKIHVSVSVLNRGPTIPSDELAAIFGGFVRGSEAKKRRIAGSGIGLAVSRRLAEAMGGTLEARSEAGTTEFTLQLRLEPTEKPTTEPPPACSPASRRALAIEDETYNRMVLQHILEQLGFEADWAETGEQALKLATSKSYDVILTDLALPDVDGITLAQRLLAQVPEPKPPIIAVTAYCTPEKIQQARRAGITGFLTKPVSARKLSELLANYRFQKRRRPARAAKDSYPRPL